MMRAKRVAMYMIVFFVGLLFILQGCGGGNDTDTSTVTPTAGARMPDYPDVIGEYVQIDGGAQSTESNVIQTPSQFNKATFLRVRSALDGENPKPANAVIVAMPGFSSTPGHWMYLASQLVHKANLMKGACSDGGTAVDCRLEIWVVQRRGAHLADTLGARNAIINNDPSLAVNYYFGASIMGSDGRTSLAGKGKFPVAAPKTLTGRPDATWQPLLQGDLKFIADWGFEAYARDVDNMIALVSQQSGSKNIFLAGHSQGGTFTSVYPGRLGTDNKRGNEKLAGIIMLDGGGYGTAGTPTATDISSHSTAIDELRSGVRPVYTDAAGANIASGPANGAKEISSLRYANVQDMNVESLFGPRQAGMLTTTTFPGTTAATANTFLGTIRLSHVARAGMSFDTSPTTTSTVATPLQVNLQESLVIALGESLGLLDFTPVTGKENDCDNTPTGKCVPLTSQIDPTKIYGWREAGGGSTIPTTTKVGVGKASEFLKGYIWTTNRTNITPITYNFPISGNKTIDAREIVTANWYPSERYDLEMSFVGKGPTFVFDYKGVKIDVDKSVVNLPLYYAHQGPPSSTNPSVFPLVTDYTNIGSTGTVQSAGAAAKSPIPATVNSQYYKHTDFVSADDSLGETANPPAPGQPGANLISNTLVNWIFARTGSKPATVPSPKDLGVINTR